MFKEIREWFRDYKYVGHVNQKISWIDDQGNDDGKDDVTYILLEDSAGHRKCEVHSTISSNQYDNKNHMYDGTRLEFYTNSVAPWLSGANPPELLKRMHTDLDELDGGSATKSSGTDPVVDVRDDKE